MGFVLSEPAGTPLTELQRVVEQACTEAACAAVGVTLLQGEGVAVLGSSLLGRQLEEAQWDLRQGPGIDAVRQLQVFNVSSLAATLSWPEFTARATAFGARSTLAVPVILRGRARGVLDLYATEPGAFDGCERVGLQFADLVARTLSSDPPVDLRAGGSSVASSSAAS